MSEKAMTITFLALVSHSDPHHLIISLHSCLPNAFLALYLDGKLFETVSDFHSLCTAPSIYMTQSQLKTSSDTEMAKVPEYLFRSGKILL